MQVIVLGGSAASPNTGAGCSGYLVQHAGVNVVLDLGPGTLPELRRHTDFRTLDAVVISHLHPDHTLDLFTLQYSLAYNPQRPPGPMSVWLPPGGAVLLERLTSAYGDLSEAPGFFSANLNVHEYDPARPLRIGPLRVDFAPGRHAIPSWAMRVHAHGHDADLGYTGDTGPSAPLAGFFSVVAVLLAEATLLEAAAGSEATRGSLTAREAGELAERAGAGTLVLTHLWEERGFERALAAARTTYSGAVTLARPGLRIDCV